MEIEMKLISKEMVKPSKPTPHNLRTHKLCLLDQLSPETYIPAIFFYPMDNKSHNDLEKLLIQLKTSLSETLTLYYPLAGRMKNSTCVNCSDEGVLFTQAQAVGRLSDFICQTDLRINRGFFPFDPECKDYDYSPLVAIKVTTFECGGLAISSLMFHKILDATSMSTFFKTWAQYHTDKPIQKPDLSSSSTIFPAIQDTSIFSLVKDIIGDKDTQKQYTKRRFVFESKALASIKSKATSEDLPNPSTTEAVTAFLTKKFMGIKVMRGDVGTTMMWHAVNLRPRMELPLSQESFGNILWLVNAFVEEADPSLAELVFTLHNMIANLTADAIKQLQGEEAIIAISHMLKDMDDLFKSTKINVFKFTSWRSMGLYDIDFGWGSPIWVGQNGEYTSFIDLPNIVMFHNHGCSGIEAWITLEKEEMDFLENDQEFLEIAILNPSIEVGK